MGKLINAKIKTHAKDKERDCIARFLDLERISTYTIESYEGRIKNLLSINGAEVFWLRPIGFHIDDKLRVSLFYPKSVSLYEMLHSDLSSPNHFNRILKDESEHTLIRIKYEIACRLAKIMLTIHSLSSIMHHGHLTSHNIFVSLKKIVNNTFEIKVRIADIELFDFMEYCNIFSNYRMTSVWSAPEAL